MGNEKRDLRTKYTGRRLRPLTIKVDLGELAHNMRTIRALVGEGTAVSPVIKANAYGLGAVDVAPVFMENGARYLAVATLTEALDLREAYPDYPIFILGYTPSDLSDIVVENRFTQCVIDYPQAEALSAVAAKRGVRACVHLAVDTGLVRLGMTDPEEAKRITALPGIFAEGIFSHLSLASEAADNEQLARFLSFASEIEKTGFRFRYKHIADSVATVDKPSFRLDMVRPGSICYGLHSWESGAVLDVHEAIRVESEVTQVHSVGPGTRVSYGDHWRSATDRTSLIATIPFGYADGYPRRLWRSGYVTIKGVRCPFAGIIGMDQCMVAATAVRDVRQGDRVVVYGRGGGDGMTLQEAADICDTYKNDIIARLMARPPREYVNISTSRV